MRLPTRRSQKQKIDKDGDEPIYLTKSGIEQLKRTLKDLEENQLPQAIADTRETGEHGDFSENAEYQEAKSRMRRCHNRITSIKEQLKMVIEIEEGSQSDKVVMGSKVVIEQNGIQKTFQIVGSKETSPLKGRISFKSPIGAKLMGRKVGETIIVLQNGKEVEIKLCAILV